MGKGFGADPALVNQAPAGLGPSGFDRGEGPGGSDNAIALADAIVRGWERARVPITPAHEVQLALVAAKFLVRIANSKEGRRNAKN